MIASVLCHNSCTLLSLTIDKVNGLLTLFLGSKSISQHEKLQPVKKSTKVKVDNVRMRRNCFLSRGSVRVRGCGTIYNCASGASKGKTHPIKESLRLQTLSLANVAVSKFAGMLSFQFSTFVACCCIACIAGQPVGKCSVSPHRTNISLARF